MKGGREIMSAVCSGLRTYLLTITGVTNLVSPRIRHEALTQNKQFTTGVLTNTSSDHMHTHSDTHRLVHYP